MECINLSHRLPACYSAFSTLALFSLFCSRVFRTQKHLSLLMGDTASLSLRLPVLLQPYLSKLLSRPSLCFPKQLYPLVFSSRHVSYSIYHLYYPLEIIQSLVLGSCTTMEYASKKFILPCGPLSLVCLLARSTPTS